jgi:hypothetical protein
MRASRATGASPGARDRRVVMAGRNITELAANNQEIDGQQGFEATFPPTEIHELMLEFAPHHSGPPIVTLTEEGGGTQTIHMRPSPGREGRFATQVLGGKKFTAVRVTTARDIVAKLAKVKMISGAHAPTTAMGGHGTPAAKPPTP